MESVAHLNSRCEWPEVPTVETPTTEFLLFHCELGAKLAEFRYSEGHLASVRDSKRELEKGKGEIPRLAAFVAVEAAEPNSLIQER